MTRICRVFFAAMRNDKTRRTHELRPRESRLMEKRRFGNKRAVHYSAAARLARHAKLNVARSVVDASHFTPGGTFCDARLGPCLQTARHNAGRRVTYTGCVRLLKTERTFHLFN